MNDDTNSSQHNIKHNEHYSEQFVPITEQMITEIMAGMSNVTSRRARSVFVRNVWYRLHTLFSDSTL